MKPLPIVYVTDMERSLAFYRSLAPNATTTTESPMWTELDLGGSILALHGIEDAPSQADSAVAIAFNSDEQLETVVTRMTAAGYECEEIVEQPFGRSVVVTSPDELRIQVNEH